MRVTNSPLLWILVGFLVGSTSWSSNDGGGFDWKSFLDAIQWIINSLVMPLYTAGAILYVVSLSVQRSKLKNGSVASQEEEEHDSIVKSVLHPLADFCSSFSLARRKRSKNGGSAAPEGVTISTPETLNGPEQDDTVATPPITSLVNLTGSYKLVHSENFDAFLEAQGVPWFLRKAAAKAPQPVHHITHAEHTLRIQITGIITSDTTYVINGPPVQTQIRDRIFLDHVTYLPTGDGIRIYKQVQNYDYDLVVTRRLTKDDQFLILTSTAVFKDDTRENAQAVQTFERINN